MATITSSSTLADVRAAYLDNLSYETDGSVAKARAFVEACRAILSWPSDSMKETVRSMFDLTRIENQLTQAQDWIAANNTSGAHFGQVKHVDFGGFRD